MNIYTLLNYPINLRVWLILPYFIMLVAGLMIPSDGGHGFLNIKSLAFLLSTVGIGIYILIQHQGSERQLKLSLFLVSALTFLFTWSLISLARQETPFESILDQFKIFCITISVVGLTLLLVYERLLTYSTFVKTLIYANFAYSSLKLFLVTLHLIGLIDMWSILEMIGFRFMRMGILGNLSRLQTSVDIITPFLLFFVLQSEELEISLSRKFRWLYVVISVLSIFLSFSRFLIAIGFISLLLYGFTLSMSAMFRWLCLTLAIGVAALSWIGIDNVQKIIELRFSSRIAALSDETRVKQIEALLSESEEYPWLGKGMGSYSKQETRDLMNRHSYEVQWIAFLMQFGAIGLLFLLIPLGFIGSLFFFGPFSQVKLACFLLFGLWLLAGFTNPFLISLTSGIVYSLFLLTGIHLRQQC